MDWLTRFFQWFPTRSTEGINLVAAGLDALHEAERIWQLDVIDPKRLDDTHQASRDIIDNMIRSKDGLGWSWLKPYEGDGQFEWCGAFVKRCWHAAGVRFDLGYTFFASTIRLLTLARYEPWEKVKNPRPKEGPYRMLIELNEHSNSEDVFFEDGTRPRSGDILIVGGKASGPGKHITLIESFDPYSGTFRTYEGNAFGMGPNAVRRQGVVRASRQVGLKPTDPPTLYHARWVIRLAPSDLVRKALAA